MSQPEAALAASDQPPARRYDVALLDLDGVIYVGPTGVPGATEALAAARSDGMRLAFVTNNALRTPAAVAAHLTELGVPADPAEVITSSQAACRVLAERLPGSRVLVVGGEGLRVAAAEAGLTVVDSADDEPAAVVQGYSPDVGWRQFAEATVAINRGAYWLATNLDVTLPSPRGPLPGNGSLVAAIRSATGVEPPAAGKPDPAMHRESLLRSGASNPIVVGDRLDTDILGAARVGCDSLLVLTGVTTATILLAAPAGQRPTYLSAGLDGLLTAHPSPAPAGDGWSCGGWTASRGGGLVLAGEGADDIDALRALCAAAWSAGPAGAVHADGAAAAAVVARLGLDGTRPGAPAVATARRA
ncbi:MAG: glycerol-phosphatase [Mycobacteriales bacterium]